MTSISSSSYYTPLHLHSSYSLLDGAIQIPELIQYLKKNNFKSCGLTDHGWGAGLLKFYKECKKNNIKPVLGIEAYITEDEDGKKERTRDNMHMVLLAKDNIGYQKLIKLSSEAALNNFYYKPRIHKQKLKELSGHVIATSACLGSVLAKKIEFRKDQFGKAVDVEENGPTNMIKEIEFYLDVFGEDFYLEIQDWDNEDHFQFIYNRWIIKHSEMMKVPLVITSDAHYLKKEDVELHEILMAMQLGMKLQQYKESPDMQYGPHFYVKTSEEMLLSSKFWNKEEAFWNTNKISDMCNVEIELGKYKEPIFKLEEAEDYQEFLQWKEKGIFQERECGVVCSKRH